MSTSSLCNIQTKNLEYLMAHPNSVEISILVLSKFKKIPDTAGFVAVADLDFCRVVYDNSTGCGRYIIRIKNGGIIEETNDFANVIAFIASKWW